MKQYEIPIWIVVHVFRGLIEDAEVFRKRKPAMARERQLRKTLNPDYDELDVFRRTV